MIHNFIDSSITYFPFLFAGKKKKKGANISLGIKAKLSDQRRQWARADQGQGNVIERHGWLPGVKNDSDIDMGITDPSSAYSRSNRRGNTESGCRYISKLSLV